MHIRNLSVLFCAAIALAARAETVKIASVCPLSGAQAGLGEMIKLGAQLAVEEAHGRFKAKGVSVELSAQDDQATPDVGVAVARRLVNDPEVLGVVGHLNSGVAMPSSEVYKDYKLVMVSPANTNPKITDRGYPNVNRVCGRDDVQGPVGAEFAVNDLKAKRIFVIHDKTAYGQGIAEACRDKLKALGATVVAFTGTEEKSNFQSLILQMKGLKPDLVYFGGIYDQGGVLVKQMRERGITAHFVSDDAFDSSEFVKIAQNASAGVCYTAVAGPVDSFPAAKPFAEKFKAKFGKMPESYALTAYDAANIILAGLEAFMNQNGGRIPSREQLSAAVRQVSHKGITGQIDFDAKGDRKLADYYIIRFEKAEYPGKLVKSTQAAPPSK